MRTNRVDSTSSAVTAGVTTDATGAGATAPAPEAAPAAPVDRVSLEQVGQVRTSVAAGVTMAASERSERLSSLAQAVRAGTYRPSASQLASQILAEAELDAKLAKAMS